MIEKKELTKVFTILGRLRLILILYHTNKHVTFFWAHFLVYKYLLNIGYQNKYIIIHIYIFLSIVIGELLKFCEETRSDGLNKFIIIFYFIVTNSNTITDIFYIIYIYIPRFAQNNKIGTQLREGLLNNDFIITKIYINSHK